MRKLFALLSVLFAFNAPGAIKYFTDYPVNASPSNSFALPMDTGDHALGGVPYNYITMEQLTEWLQAKGFTNGAVTIITTNITVVVPGSSINLNLTPLTLIMTAANDDQMSVPNGPGFLTNNGAGLIGWNTVLAITELDAQNANLTNIFTFLTNAPLLSTDGDGKIQAGNFLVATNNDTVVSNGLYAQITASGPANLAAATNNDTLISVALSNIVATLSLNGTNFTLLVGANDTNNDNRLSGNATNEVTRQINSPTNIYSSLGTAISDVSLATNLSYIIKTNNGGGNALVAGAPGTAATMYLTNITANTTLAAATFWSAGGSVIPVYVSCSGGTDRVLKFPANWQGAGDLYGVDLNGTGVSITNGEASWFELRCIYGVKTNVFRSNTK